MHGVGKLTLKSGEIYECTFVQGVKEGKGVRKFLNGDIYYGEFHNEMR